MKTFHIEIDINEDGDMFICEDGCTGECYRVDGSVDDLIDQISICLYDYLHCEHEYDSEVEYKDWQKEVMKADIKKAQTLKKRRRS